MTEDNDNRPFVKKKTLIVGINFFFFGVFQIFWINCKIEVVWKDNWNLPYFYIQTLPFRLKTYFSSNSRPKLTQMQYIF